MFEIRRIAKIYFEEFEGFHLYTKPKTWILYIWIIALITVIFVNTAVVILISFHRAPEWYAAFALASDVFLALTSQSFANQRESKVHTTMELRDGFSFDSLESCKRSRLSILLGIRPENFLESASDICRMKEILDQHDPIGSKSVSKILSQYLYDSRSKDRLMNLGLVFVGVIVTLSATSNASLENLFEAFSSDTFLTFVALLEMLAIVGFLLWILVHMLWFSFRSFFSQWGAKLSNAKLGGNTEVAYMVCDLVRLHRRPPLARPTKSVTTS